MERDDTIIGRRTPGVDITRRDVEPGANFSGTAFVPWMAHPHAQLYFYETGRPGGSADIADLDFGGCRLWNAGFVGADLERTSFDGASLHKADLSFTKLAGATFDGADVFGVDFCGADLRECDLRGAQNLTLAQVLSGIVDATTQVPDDISAAVAAHVGRDAGSSLSSP